MRFTGERFIPSEQGKIRLEHYHRYAAVLNIIKNKRVLDVACGEGYGSSYLASVAYSVVGVDISTEAIQHASVTYPKANLTFRQGSATALDFADAIFDVVISFETIEHLLEQAKMLSEIKRVLHPDGILVISSPNRPIYSEVSGQHNEFHVKELDFNELDILLSVHFPVVQYFGQRMLIGSVIQPIEGVQSTIRVWHDDGMKLETDKGHLTSPEYFLAVCCTRNSALPYLDSSILFPKDYDLVHHYTGFAKWAKSLDKTVSKRDYQIAILNKTIEKLIVQIDNPTTETLCKDERITGIEAELNILRLRLDNLTNETLCKDDRVTGIEAELNILRLRFDNLANETLCKEDRVTGIEAELNIERLRLSTIYASNSWKITSPLREARRFLSSPGQQMTRYINASLRLLKRVYQSLPINHLTNAMHRNFVAKYLPNILIRSGTHSATIPVFCIPNLNTHSSIIDTLDSTASLLTYAATVDIPDHASPHVSVIIPVYGQIKYTLRCLASIAANLPQAAFEVIIVDDFSSDATNDVLSMINGVRVFRNEQNLGFIRSCNKGAKMAKGEYLYFLNNDTEVTSGWLDELLRTFHEFPGTGLTGSKLIYPDGRLQEAGGIIWQDGTAWNFGRFQDPQLPVYNYAREVDYCSGASIMVSKSLFDEMGGFDEHYLPAYCEDSDLALKIRDKGYRVIYQPMSIIIHYEGITSGTNTSHGTKSYQIQNTKKLYERWKLRLNTHQSNGIDVDNAKDRRATRRALMIDHCTPTPDQDSGSIDALNIMLLLREMDFQVTFIPEDNFLYMQGYTTALQRAGIEVLYAPFNTSVEQHLYSCSNRYDLALLFRPLVAERYTNTIRKLCSKAKIIFHTVDLHFLRMTREAIHKSDSSIMKAAEEMKQRELSLISASDIATVVSSQEKTMLLQYFSTEKVCLLQYSRHIDGTTIGFEERRDIVFIGGFQHTPNVDAVMYFVSEIMPLLRQSLPEVRFYVVGSKPPAEILALASEDVIITGYVQHLTPLLNKMRVSVAPLRYGAGIKGKIGTAMAVGLPVVATPLAAEGMSLTDGQTILVADTAQSFSDAVSLIYQDKYTWNRISTYGLAFAKETWGAESAWQNLEKILSKLGMECHRGAHRLNLYINQ